ncbi:hypothetical protein IAT40_003398 [Kwoniella sp. CBS 6097]
MSQSPQQANGIFFPNAKVYPSSKETAFAKKVISTRFPPELWLQIAPHIHDIKALNSLCLASKGTNAIASPHLHETIRLATPEALEEWLTNTDRQWSLELSGTKNLEINFDLEHLQNKRIRDALFDRSHPRCKRPGENQLSTLLLTTSGFEHSRYGPKTGVGEKLPKTVFKKITLGEAVDRLLDILVGEFGPDHFKWEHKARPTLLPQPQREAQHASTSSLLPRQKPSSSSSSGATDPWASKAQSRRQKASVLSARKKTAVARLPSMTDDSVIFKWMRISTLELPCLVRPTWASSPTTGTDEKIERKLRYVSIQASSIKAWMKGEALWDLVQELFMAGEDERKADEHCRQAPATEETKAGTKKRKIILELNGPFASDSAQARNREWVLALNERQDIIDAIWAERRNESAEDWRKRIMSEDPVGSKWESIQTAQWRWDGYSGHNGPNDGYRNCS